MKLVLSGGHLTPAFSLAEIATENNDQILLIGSAGENSIEANEFKKLNIKYASIKEIKYNRHRRLLSIIGLPRLLSSILDCIGYLKKWNADCVITFGSFNAVPVGVAAWILGIPLIIHEQTRTTGLANRLLSHFASKCLVSYQESTNYFPKSKTTLVGNPIRSIFWKPPQTMSLVPTNSKPILYITGGNQGSEAIVRVIETQLEELTKHYFLIIQFGKSNIFQSTHTSKMLAKNWFSAEETAYIMHHSHLMVSRGGANTIAEIMIAGVPAILIPLPQSSNNEQAKNALFIQEQKAGLVISQDEFNSQSVMTAINTIESNYSQFKTEAVKLKKMQNPQAADSMYELIKQLTRNK